MYKVAEHLFGGVFKDFFLSKRQNTVRHGVTKSLCDILKVFQNVIFFGLFNNVRHKSPIFIRGKAMSERGLLATFGLCIPFIEISEL